jgi:hypothetical protein
MSDVEIAPEYLMGCLGALTVLVAKVAQQLPGEERQSIIDSITKVQVAVEATWKDARPEDRDPHAQAIGLSETYRMFLITVANY